MTHEKTKVYLAACSLLASVPAFVLGMATIAQMSSVNNAVGWGIFGGLAYGILLSVMAGLATKVILEDRQKRNKKV